MDQLIISGSQVNGSEVVICMKHIFQAVERTEMTGLMHQALNLISSAPASGIFYFLVLATIVLKTSGRGNILFVN